MAKKSTKSVTTKNYVVAKTDDGGVQITFTIDIKEINKAKDDVAFEYAKTTVIPGFRKGKAPISKVISKIDPSTLIQKALNKILPKYLEATIHKEQLKLAIYPRFELVSTEPDKDWQVRAISCEIPKVILGKYEEEIKLQKKKHTNSEDKEHIVIHAILESTKVEIPKVLIDEEVNSRLSKLVERIEKLGLTVEKYLESVGKDVNTLREEYEKQSREALILDLALPLIAQKEGLSVSEKAIDGAISASAADPKLAQKLNTPYERNMVKSILLKKSAIDKLVTSLEK